MAKASKMQRKSGSQRLKLNPYPLASCPPRKVVKDSRHCRKKYHATIEKKEKKEWENAICSVCLEYPHNAVLLLCSSYNMGCRPYMCGTSHRYSNCLDQYKKAYARVASTQCANELMDQITYNLGTGESSKMEVSELLCPLCRGQVKGWTVVEEARDYLNTKRRTCMHNNCSFSGTYKALRKHVRTEHPLAQPRAVDPAQEEKWKRLEREREREDVLSTINSSMPGAMVLGDYVIEGNFHNIIGDMNLDFFGDIRLDSSGPRWNGGMGQRGFHRVRRTLEEGNNTIRRIVPSSQRMAVTVRRGHGRSRTAAMER